MDRRAAKPGAPHGRHRHWAPLVAAPLVAAALGLAGCSGGGGAAPRIVAGGDSSQGRRLIEHYGCGSCHTIPGVRGANALVGPPLIHWAGRSYIAGELANTPDNLIRWLQDPKSVEPATDMPNLGVSQAEARNIAAYLDQIR